MKSLLLLPIALILIKCETAHSQVSGNQAYKKNYNYSSASIPDKGVKLYLNDSCFIIRASILDNITADAYVAVFGVAQESSELKDCNNKINSRINGFTSGLQKMGIATENIFIDLTTQNKIYDYKVSTSLAEEFLEGFELKKNVIVKFKNISDLEKMMILASDFQIYDLVKVDYIVEDINQVYTTLFKAAMEIINQKKLLFVGATNMKVLPSSEIYSENFYCLNPDQLYDTYQAYESGDVSLPYNSTVKIKKIRKSQTVYYNKMNYSGFDKVLNPAVTEPAVEYGLTLEIKYQIEKQKNH